MKITVLVKCEFRSLQIAKRETEIETLDFSETFTSKSQEVSNSFELGIEASVPVAPAMDQKLKTNMKTTWSKATSESAKQTNLQKRKARNLEEFNDGNFQIYRVLSTNVSGPNGCSADTTVEVWTNTRTSVVSDAELRKMASDYMLAEYGTTDTTIQVEYHVSTLSASESKDVKATIRQFKKQAQDERAAAQAWVDTWWCTDGQRNKNWRDAANNWIGSLNNVENLIDANSSPDAIRSFCEKSEDKHCEQSKHHWGMGGHDSAESNRVEKRAEESMKKMMSLIR
jgi:hypothetical protein